MARKDALANLRQILVKRRDALRKALAGDLTQLSGLKEQTVGDMIDAALDSEHNEINSQLAEVESRELAQIEYALEKMRAGTFGICERCDTKIPMARLNALPYATLCIHCQREVERLGETEDVRGDWSRLLDASGDDVDVSINDIELDVS
jgi:DnaK suppressor protein